MNEARKIALEIAGRLGHPGTVEQLIKNAKLIENYLTNKDH